MDGKRVRTDPANAELPALRGAVLRRFLPPALLAHVEAVEPQFAELATGSRCAGHDYPMVVVGDLDSALFWRTLPWDHSPCALFVHEAAGVAARLDGSAYLPITHARPGLLVARTPAIWAQVGDALVPEEYRGAS